MQYEAIGYWVVHGIAGVALIWGAMWVILQTIIGIRDFSHRLPSFTWFSKAFSPLRVPVEMAYSGLSIGALIIGVIHIRIKPQEGGA